MTTYATPLDHADAGIYRVSAGHRGDQPVCGILTKNVKRPRQVREHLISGA
jgi:hypothetical protein